jgi:hypothetical protein
MTDTRKGIGTIAVGAVLLIAAVVGFVVLPEHQPGCVGSGAYCGYLASPPSQPLYDALRITTWALLIVGALAVVLGLIRYARRP